MLCCGYAASGGPMIPTRATLALAAALTLAAAGCNKETPAETADTPAPPPTTNTTTPESADERLTAEIRAKLGPSRAYSVNVETKAGEVKLQGMVANHEERETIEG